MSLVQRSLSECDSARGIHDNN